MNSHFYERGKFINNFSGDGFSDRPIKPYQMNRRKKTKNYLQQSFFLTKIALNIFQKKFAILFITVMITWFSM